MHENETDAMDDSPEPTLPREYVMVWIDEKGEIQAGVNGYTLADVPPLLGMAKAKTELLMYQIAKQRAEQTLLLP